MKPAIILYLQILFPGIISNEGDTLKLLFLGDIMQHQTQLDAASVKRSTGADSSTYDFSSYFRHLEKRFDKADIRVANMETTFAGPPYSGYPNFTSPASLLQESKKAGIDIFLTANNHICDKGKRGLSRTLDLYDSLGFLYTGIYRNPLEEIKRNPLIINSKDFKIAFLNYTYGTNGITAPPPFIVKQIDTSSAKIDLARTMELKPDYIIVCLHWGEEYKVIHSAEQERVEKFFYDNGADVIIGSHPHVPQDYKVLYGVNGEISHITIYSLGNAISNMTAPNTRIGMMAEIAFAKGRDGSNRILKPKIEYIWTSRPGMVEENFSILPIEDFIDKPGLFKRREDYRNMKRHYSQFRK